MRKFGLIAAIVGFGAPGGWTCCSECSCQFELLGCGFPGAALLSGGSALFLWSRWASARPRSRHPRRRRRSAPTPHACWTTSSSALPSSRAARPAPRCWATCTRSAPNWSSAAAAVQATAVYRHLARIDNTYRDVAARLRRLMDAERAKPKAAPAPAAAAGAAAAAAAAARPTPTGAQRRRSGSRRHARRARAAAPPATPQRLGRYQLEREIGRGAMGVVYLGRDTAINRTGRDQSHPARREFSECGTRRSENALLSRGRNCGPPQSSEHRDHL